MKCAIGGRKKSQRQTKESWCIENPSISVQRTLGGERGTGESLTRDRMKSCVRRKGEGEALTGTTRSRIFDHQRKHYAWTKEFSAYTEGRRTGAQLVQSQERKLKIGSKGQSTVIGPSANSDAQFLLRRTWGYRRDQGK